LTLNLEPDRDVVLSGSPQEVVVKVDLTAIGQKKHLKRTPLNIAVVLDRSGSMAGAKIEKARQAAMELVDHLAPGDIFSMITYSDQAQVLVPAQRIEDKESVKSRIARIRPGGSTALYAGVKCGAEQIESYLSEKRINRVMLLSDGLANIGPSSPADLRKLGRALSERGISVTTIGVGEDYNEDLMAGLAEASDANYYYVKDTEKLPGIFAKELGELMTVVARGVRIEITCPDGVRPLGFIGRPEKFEGLKAVIELSHFTPGQNRCLFLRCLSNGSAPELARVRATFTDELGGGVEDSISGTVKVRFTNDPKLAERSIHPDVAAQKELVLAALAKDDALAAADAGKYQSAAETLSRQAASLDIQYPNASPALRSQLRQEAENLRYRSNQLQQNQYDSATRKTLQSESWTIKNSK
jgi:Ca-activated chloride channel family protein